MIGLWSALIGLFQSLVQPIITAIDNIYIYRAGQTAANTTGLIQEQQNEAKVAAAGNAADHDAIVNPDSLRQPDEFSRD